MVWDWERGVALGTALAHGEGAVLGCAFVPGSDDAQAREREERERVRGERERSRERRERAS